MLGLAMISGGKETVVFSVVGQIILDWNAN
jgi:hypothetical protein